MNNQLITFQGNSVMLPPNFEWKIFSVFEPDRVSKPPLTNFKNFDQCVHKGQVRDGFHLFELHVNNTITMAFCHIVESVKVGAL